MDARRAINERAMAQHGLVTRADLAEVGVTPAVRRRLQRNGDLVTIGRNTFRVGGAPTGDVQRAHAAALDTDGVLSHRTAAAMHRLGDLTIPDRPEITVVRRTYDYATPGIAVHTTTWLPRDHVVTVEGVRCLSIARTLFSLAACAEVSTDVLSGLVDEAVAERKASDAWLWWMLERLRCRGRTGVGSFEAILTVRAAGSVTESWLEREFLAVLERAGAPLPACQRRISARGAFVARVDFRYDDEPLVIEVSGHAWHHTRAQREADTARRRKLTLAGFHVLEFTYEDIVGRPAEVVAQVLAARTLVAPA